MHRMLFLLVAFIFLLSGCNEDSDLQPETYPFTFQFITEDLAPLNYMEGTELKGLAPDLLREICANLNISFKVSTLSWSQGYQAALSGSNAVLFSTVLNSTRKGLFKWAGPYASVDWVLYASSPTEIDLNTLDEAKSLGKVGVIKDYGVEQHLVAEGFTNLVYVNDNIEGFNKLLNGDIEVFASANILAEPSLKMLGKTIWAVTPVLTVLTDFVYFAFNKQVPDDVVADFQNEINELRNNGTLLKLHQKYMEFQNPPAELMVYTEQYPPITFRNSFGEITGFGTDVVKEIMKKNGTIYPVTLSLWSNGYTLIQNNPNFCLFTMDRTPARDTLFQWVGPLGSNKTYFFVKTGSSVTVASIEDAKNLTSVGTVSSWFSDQYLRQLGFTNLISDPDPAVMVQKLIAGEVDAFVCSAVTFPDIVKTAGFKLNQVAPAFELMSTDYYIAFSKSTSAVIVSQWQNQLESLKDNGIYDAIYRKWFPF